jgi:hypothetical protein
MSRPTDNKKKKVGKENNIQNDFFGTLLHDFSDAFPGQVSKPNEFENNSAYLPPFIDGVLIVQRLGFDFEYDPGTNTGGSSNESHRSREAGN